MKVLVTGATGFLGHAMLAWLEDLEGVDAVAGVRNDTGRSHNSTETLVLGDLEGPPPTLEALREINAIIHCAARVHVLHTKGTETVEAYRAANVDGTMKLANQAAKAGVRRFIFVSTVKVNGEATPTGSKFTADDEVSPADPYGRSKWEAEKALLALSKNSGMEVVIVRPPLVYGPGVGANFLSMMRWVKKGVPLPLANTQNQRSLVYVHNLTSLLWTCVVHPKAVNQIFLVSDGADLSTSQLLLKLAKYLREPSRLFPFPRSALKSTAHLMGKSSIFDRLFGSLQVDISKTQSTLEWTPPFDSDDGLRSTAVWFNSLR